MSRPMRVEGKLGWGLPAHKGEYRDAHTFEIEYWADPGESIDVLTVHLKRGVWLRKLNYEKLPSSLKWAIDNLCMSDFEDYERDAKILQAEMLCEEYQLKETGFLSVKGKIQ